MKNLPVISFILLWSVTAFSNIAQPGLRSAGGSGGFTLLFEEDTAYYHQIQMKREQVFVQLHKGFAVVKGIYQMYNHHPKTISLRAGYPVNALFSSDKEGSRLTEVLFDDLYQLRVEVEGREISTQKVAIDAKSPPVRHLQYGQTDWYIWENHFPPNTDTEITVYFLVNTNDANILEGYDNQPHNGFVYVLETGATWKPPIGEGSIFIQLADGLQQKHIKGISSKTPFRYDEQQNALHTQFKNLIPTREDNIVLTYYRRQDDFDFSNIIVASEELFGEMDRFSAQIAKGRVSGEVVDFGSPFDISNVGSTLIGGLFLFMVIGVPVLVGLLIVFLIYQFLRRRRKRKGKFLSS